MTTPSTARKAGPLLGNGSTTSFPFTFKVFAASDIAVTTANALGVETALVLDTDYSVTLNANQETSPGGTVTYPISGTPLATGSVLAIVGDLDYDQPLDLPSGGNFSPLALENQLDRTVMQIQQLREEGARSLRIPVTSNADTDLPMPEAGQLIGWNAGGTALENIPVDNLATAVGYGTFRYDTFTGNGTQTQFALTADPALVGNLDVAIDGLTQVPGVDYTLISGVLTFTVAPTNTAQILARYGQALPITGPVDASAVTYQPDGAGAVATTVQTKLRESVSVMDFGAVGDGTTDDTAAIQAAVNSHAGTVIVPPGQYKISSVNVPYDVNLVGSGRYDTAAGTSQFVITGNGFVLDSNAANISFRNLAFNGKNANVKGIYSANDNFFSILLQDCNFFFFAGHPVYFNNTNYLRVDNCWFNGNTTPAYFGASNGLVTNTLFEGGSTSMEVNVLVELYKSGAPAANVMMFRSVQFERSKVGIKSNTSVDIEGLTYSNVIAPVYAYGGVAYMNNFVPVANNHEVFGMLIGDAYKYEFNKVAVNGSSAYVRVGKSVKKETGSSTPSTWARVDGSTNNFLVACDGAATFDTTDYSWLQNAGTNLPEGSSCPKVSLGSLAAGQYVVELISSGTGYFNVKDGATYLLQQTVSDGSCVNRGIITATGNALYAYPGAAALGGNYIAANVYKNLYADGGFEGGTTSAVQILAGTTSFSTTTVRPGSTKSLSLTNGSLYLDIPVAGRSKVVEAGVYVYVPTGASLTVSSYGAGRYNSQDMLIVAGDNKWHLFRTPIMYGTNAFPFSLKFITSDTVYFDDATCIEMQ